MSKKDKERLLGGSDSDSDAEITNQKSKTAHKGKKPGMMDWLFKPAQGYNKAHTGENDMDQLSDDEDSSLGGPGANK